MKFNICLSNLRYRDSVGDKAMLVKFGLQEIGKYAIVSDLILDDHINVFFEGFEESFIEALNKDHPRARTVIIATEWITGGTFNNFKAQSQSTYDQKDRWQKRFDGFLHLAGRTEAVWCLSPVQLTQYRSLVKVPVSYLPHAYVASYCETDLIPDADRPIDFLFSGTMTAHRRTVLEALQALGYKVVFFAPNTPAYLRFEMYKLAKVTLGLRTSEDWQYPSVSRIHYCLSHLRPHIVEEHPEQSDLDAFTTIAPRDGLIDALVGFHTRHDRQESAVHARERFARDFPLAPVLEKLVAAIPANI